MKEPKDIMPKYNKTNNKKITENSKKKQYEIERKIVQNRYI